MKLSVILMVVTHFSLKVVQGYRVNEGNAQRPSSPKGPRTTHNASTKDVVKTVIYMVPPSGTPERDPLNPSDV